jgi:hypothetical protein
MITTVTVGWFVRASRVKITVSVMSDRVNCCDTVAVCKCTVYIVRNLQMWPRPAVGHPPDIKGCAGMEEDFGALSWHCSGSHSFRKEQVKGREIYRLGRVWKKLGKMTDGYV